MATATTAAAIGGGPAPINSKDFQRLLIDLTKKPKCKDEALKKAVKSILSDYSLTAAGLSELWETYVMNSKGIIERFTVSGLDPFRKWLKIKLTVGTNVLGKRSINMTGIGDAVTPKKPHVVVTLTGGSRNTGMDFMSPISATTVSPSPPSSARVSMSPAPPLKYNARANSGKVVAQLNTEMEHVDPSSASNLAQFVFSEMNMKEKRIGCANLAKIAAAERDRVMELGQEILDREDLEYTQCNIPSSGTVATFGKVCNDASSGKMNLASVMLEGPTGASVQLDFAALKPTLFPGQVIAVEGKNPTGRKLHVERFWEGITTKVTEQPTTDDVSMIVAVGPYTNEGLDFAPLGDLLNGEVAKFKPNVLVLMGPFCNCDPILELDDGEMLRVDYENMFAQKVAVALEETLASCPSTKIILVPSLDDPIGSSVYPQPPFTSRTSGKAALELLKTEGLEYSMKMGDLGLPKSDRLHITSNPSTFSLQQQQAIASGDPESGFTVSLTSFDILPVLNSESICKVQNDRMLRLAESMLAQRSMFPIIGETVSKTPAVDYTEYARYSLPDETPNLVILPSKLKTFCKVGPDSGSVILNPGKLLGFGSGGTYAKVSIRNGQVKADIVRI